MKNTRNAAIRALLSVTIFASPGCSRPDIKVSQDTPPTFHLSGSNTLQFFHVANKSEVIWRLHPSSNDLSLGALSTVKYGEVPSSCRQAIPAHAAPPPPLVEGEEYYAVTGIFDDDAARVRFTIKGGKVVRLPSEFK